MTDSFIPLSRALLEWDWHDEPKTGWLYVVMLMMANHEETRWRGETLRRGQLLTGRKQLSIASGLTEDEVRTALGHLKKTEDISVATKTKYSIVTMLKYEEHCPSDPQQAATQFPSNFPSKSPTESPALSPAKPQQCPSNAPADPHIQKLKNLKNLKKAADDACAREETASASAADEQMIGIDGTDMRESFRNYDRAEGLVSRFKLPDTDQSRQALIEDAERVGWEKVEKALDDAALGNSRPMLSVNFYRKILQNEGRPREAGAPQKEPMQRHSYTQTGDRMLRYSPNERKATYSAAILDFDEVDADG